jgi:hypothetical protein
MSRHGHSFPLADREVVKILGPVADTVGLNVELFVAEWGEGCRIELSARVQVSHDEQHMIDDDAPNVHPSTLTAPRLQLV